MPPLCGPAVPTEHAGNLTEALLSWFSASTSQFGLIAHYPEVRMPGTPIDSSTRADPIVLVREIAPRPENEQMNWWACYHRTHGYAEYTAERVHGLDRTGIDSIDPASGHLRTCAFILVADWRGNLWWATQIDGRDRTLAGPVFAEIAAAVRWPASDTDRH